MGRAFTILYSSFFIFAVSPHIYSQEIADVQYELIDSQDFAESINEWIFTPEESIISIDNQQINWRGDSQTNPFTLPEDALKVIFSKNGNYFAIVRLDRLPPSSIDERQLLIEVYTAGKEKLYEIRKNFYYDDSLPLIVISDLDGSLILGQNASGEILFYDSNGSLQHSLRLFSDAEYDLERILDIDLSRDGTTAAIVAGQRGASPAGSNAPHPSADPYLFLFSTKGDELSREPLPDFNTSAAAISDNGQYIAASSYTITIDGDITKRTLTFDSTGGEIGQVNMLFKQAHFSPDSKFLLLADNNTAKEINLTNGTIFWSYSVPKKEGMIAAADISNNGKIAVLLVAENEFREDSFIYTNPKLKIMNSSGDLLQNIELTDQEFKIPALKLSEDSGEILIGFKNAYQIYQVK